MKKIVFLCLCIILFFLIFSNENIQKYNYRQIKSEKKFSTSLRRSISSLNANNREIQETIKNEKKENPTIQEDHPYYQDEYELYSPIMCSPESVDYCIDITQSEKDEIEYTIILEAISQVFGKKLSLDKEIIFKKNTDILPLIASDIGVSHQELDKLKPVIKDLQKNIFCTVKAESRCRELE